MDLPLPSPERKAGRRSLPPGLLLATLAALAVFAFLSVDLTFKTESGVFLVDPLISDYVFTHPRLIGFWELITLFGSGLPIVAVVGLAATLLFRYRYRTLAVGLIFTGASGQALNELLKLLFQRARPDWHPVAAQGYSFPSGHAMGATIVYGFLIYALLRTARRGRWRLALAAAFGVLILLIAASRVVLGAHWPTDVAGGLSAGLVWLVVCVWVLEQKTHGQGKTRRP